MADTPSPDPGPSRRDRLLRADLPRRLALLSLLAGVSAAAGYLLAPPGADRLPGPGDEGRPSPVTVRADRDYDVVDAEATARRRAEAAGAERPVYDEDEGADDEARGRIRAAFALMRSEVEAQGPAGAAPEAPSLVVRRYAAYRDAFVAQLQLVLRDDDFAALAAARFAEPVEQALVAATTRGLSGLVVGDQALLPADRDAGFLVRTLRAGVPVGERLVVDRAEVRDLGAVREEVSRDVTARLAGSPAPLRAAAARLAAATIRPTLVHDQAETERRRAEAAMKVRPVVFPVKRGERIVSAGELLEPRHLAVLEAIRAQRHGADRSDVRRGAALLVALLLSALWLVARRVIGGFRPPLRDAALLALLFVGTLALAAEGQALVDLARERLPLVPRSALVALLPLAAGALVARQVLPPVAALLLAVAGGLGAGLVSGSSLGVALQAVVASLAAVGLRGRDRRPPGPWQAGLASGVAAAVVAVALGLEDGKPVSDLVLVAAAALLAGALLVPLVALLALALAEALLGSVTERTLQRLANLNHPALKELIVQAPGTYHHSILMGSLAEAAARAIGADALLARVGAYFHDVGKLKNPALFAENQRGENEHDALAPAMSALALKRHVADGLELARRWRLPRVVADVIPQHHGTRRVTYFWAKHQKLLEAGQAGPVDDAVFRYAGPRPRSREAALVMIADVCEATARALSQPDRDTLRTLVGQRLAELIREGQLDECDLTLRDLAAVNDAVVEALAGIYLGRAQGGARPAEPRPPVHLVAHP